MLEQNGLLRQVQKNIVTNAPSCSATAALLVMKKVDAIIGWRVFSKWWPDKIDAILLKPDEVPRLAYIPAAISTYSKDRDSAQRFIDFLTSPEGRKIFARWGYIATEERARKNSCISLGRKRTEKMRNYYSGSVTHGPVFGFNFFRGVKNYLRSSEFLCN